MVPTQGISAEHQEYPFSDAEEREHCIYTVQIRGSHEPAFIREIAKKCGQAVETATDLYESSWLTKNRLARHFMIDDIARSS